jgi:hypothetical protein
MVYLSAVETEDKMPSTARIAAEGMYFAAAALCSRGFNVTPTSRNMAGADLLITDDRCRNTWTIQVKVTDGKLRNRRGWLLGKKAKKTAYHTHAYVFVMLQPHKPPDFFVVPSTFVAKNQSGPASRDAALYRWGNTETRFPRMAYTGAGKRCGEDFAPPGS